MRRKWLPVLPSLRLMPGNWSRGVEVEGATDNHYANLTRLEYVIKVYWLYPKMAYLPFHYIIVVIILLHMRSPYLFCVCNHQKSADLHPRPVYCLTALVSYGCWIRLVSTRSFCPPAGVAMGSLPCSATMATQMVIIIQ